MSEDIKPKSSPQKKRPYTPFGAAKKLWGCRDEEILLEGPAGTGKSRGALEKIYFAMMKYPGARALIVRQTRESMTDSVLVTLEEKVIPAGSPVLDGPQRKLRSSYTFPNGSEIVVGGMDKPSKVMSTEYDIIGVFEGTETNEDGHESLTTRLRNGVMPYQQIIVDCNPGPPAHWLNRRATKGLMTRLQSRHRDNPMLFDMKAGEFNEQGKKYLAKLSRLSGVRRERLLNGIWAASEGVIYEVDPSSYIDEMPAGWETWRKVRSIDFGFNDPFVCLWGAIGPDGDLYIYREMYYSGRIVSQHAKGIWDDGDGKPKLVTPGIIQYSEGEEIEVTVSDHDREDRATLDAEGIDSIPAFKDILPGIEAVKIRLRPQLHGNGAIKPRLFFLRDALVERDDELIERNAPFCLSQEFDSYIWKKDKKGESTKDEPQDKDNHGCFVAGTMISTSDGEIPIEQIQVGDRVLTRQGYRKVIAAGMTSAHTNVQNVTFSDGSQLTGTSNHPIWVEDKGFIRLDALRYSDRVLQCKANVSDSRELISEDTQTQRTGQIGHISPLPFIVGSKECDGFMKRFGRIIMGRFLQIITFTIKTLTRLITTSVTLNVFRQKNISNGTLKILHPEQRFSAPRTLKKLLKQQKLGIAVKKAENGIQFTLKRFTAVANRTLEAVIGAGTFTSAWGFEPQIGFAAINAGHMPVNNQEWMTYNGHAKRAENHLPLISTLTENIAPVHVVNVSKQPSKQSVFNLTVDEVPEYFANGILVHNCDTLRYMVAYVDDIGCTQIEISAEQPSVVEGNWNS